MSKKDDLSEVKITVDPNSDTAKEALQQFAELEKASNADSDSENEVKL